MKNRKKYSDEDFINAIKTSYSISQVLLKLGLKPAGGSYFAFKTRVKKLGLDISHFTGQGYLKGKTHNWKKSISLDEILVENSSYTNTNNLRKRLISEKILENKCYNCGLTKWMDKPISLELEHKNGKRTDNRIENLTILCPNCHAQTSTYRGKNIKAKSKQKLHCKKCNKEISIKSKSGLCSPCFNKTMSHCKDRPYIEQLLQEIEETNYCVVGRKYGVSDNTIRKWIRS